MTIETTHQCEGCHPCACYNNPQNPGQTSPEVQNRAISGPTKRAYVLKKNGYVWSQENRYVFVLPQSFFHFILGRYKKILVNYFLKTMHEYSLFKVYFTTFHWELLKTL